jgi:hypothetical protein
MQGSYFCPIRHCFWLQIIFNQHKIESCLHTTDHVKLSTVNPYHVRLWTNWLIHPWNGKCVRVHLAKFPVQTNLIGFMKFNCTLRTISVPFTFLKSDYTLINTQLNLSLCMPWKHTSEWKCRCNHSKPPYFNRSVDLKTPGPEAR